MTAHFRYTKGLFLVLLLLFSFSIAAPVYAQVPAASSGNAAVDFLVNNVVFPLFGLIASFLLMVASLLAGILGMFISLLLSVASYNNFINAGGVIIGWTLTRDIVNMFFVAVFLVIALGTIIGKKEYHIKNALPKFALAAILVNFSRLILGLIIDASHVIMMTFVNAIQQVGGGNFLEAFNIQANFELAKGAGLNGFDNLLTAIMSVLLVFIATVIVGMFALMLVMRMVGLWILIAVSPLAFFLRSLDSKSFQKYYGDWEGKFKANVLMGPVIAFFLWLALAMSQGGKLYSSEVKGASDAEAQKNLEGKPGLVGSAISTIEGLSSFIISAALFLFAYQQAQQFAKESGIPGMDKLVGEAGKFMKTGAKYVSGYKALRAGGSYLTGAGARAALRTGVKLAGGAKGLGGIVAGGWGAGGAGGVARALGGAATGAARGFPGAAMGAVASAARGGFGLKAAGAALGAGALGLGARAAAGVKGKLGEAASKNIEKFEEADSNLSTDQLSDVMRRGGARGQAAGLSLAKRGYKFTETEAKGMQASLAGTGLSEKQFKDSLKKSAPHLAYDLSKPEKRKEMLRDPEVQMNNLPREVFEGPHGEALMTDMLSGLGAEGLGKQINNLSNPDARKAALNVMSTSTIPAAFRERGTHVARLGATTDTTAGTVHGELHMKRAALAALPADNTMTNRQKKIDLERDIRKLEGEKHTLDTRVSVGTNLAKLHAKETGRPDQTVASLSSAEQASLLPELIQDAGIGSLKREALQSPEVLVAIEKAVGQERFGDAMKKLDPEKMRVVATTVAGIDSATAPPEQVRVKVRVSGDFSGVAANPERAAIMQQAVSVMNSKELAQVKLDTLDGTSGAFYSALNPAAVRGLAKAEGVSQGLLDEMRVQVETRASLIPRNDDEKKEAARATELKKNIEEGWKDHGRA
ncbi:MAG: hypothetical protein HY437_00415 [Candidatus Magasanikbacteria bacterium]|nr:hypothetical protein [Candidatus Magasanikbacteria bacterium]